MSREEAIRLITNSAYHKTNNRGVVCIPRQDYETALKLLESEPEPGDAGFWGRACARLCLKNREQKKEIDRLTNTRDAAVAQEYYTLCGNTLDGYVPKSESEPGDFTKENRDFIKIAKLKEYARHKPDCNWVARGWGFKRECTCGFEQALKGNPVKEKK